MSIVRIEEVAAGGEVRTLYDAYGEDAVALLREIESFIARYVVLPRGALLPLAVWIFATHVYESFDVFPYLAISSPTPRCGKSLLLDLIGMLSHKPIAAANISEAALFRTISEDKPTLLIDEAEWLREKSERAQIIRNILNAGHRSGAVVIRCEKDGKRNSFSVFGAKAIACIGELSDTLADRSVAIQMQRRTLNEKVDRFRYLKVKREAGPLRERIVYFMVSCKEAIGEAYQDLPDLVFLDDRAADNWSPLFAVLGVADSARTEELKVCAKNLSASRGDLADDSLPLRLLSDFAAIAAERDEEVIATTVLLENARKIPESPWAGEVDLTPRKAAKWLRGFGIRVGRTESYRGYERKAILETAARYLTHQASDPSDVSVTSTEET